MVQRVALITVLICVFAWTTAMGRPTQSAHTASPSALTVHNTTYIDANWILMFVTNHGSFGRDIDDVFGYGYGTFYPYYGNTVQIENGTHIESPLGNAGLWLAGVEATSGDTLVAVSEYGSEYVPGPMSGGSFLPDVPEYRVYKLYSDSLASHPNQDYLDWPTDQSAPVDYGGKPRMLGDRMTWCVFNDASGHNLFHTEPLGIEVQQTVFAYESMGWLGHFVFMRYVLHNKGDHSLTDFYLSVWMDPDIGSYEDDKAGCDTLNDIYFAYNGDNVDDVYTSPPPAFGFKVISGPLVYSPGDNADFNGVTVPDYRNVSPSSFFVYPYGPDPDNYRHVYRLMHGLDIDGNPHVYNGKALHYMYSGDVATGSGDIDPTLDDKRMMASFGPFDFNPGDSQYVLMVIGAADNGNNIQAVAALKTLFAQINFDPTPVDDPVVSTLPDGFTLEQNYPNPFNPDTKITFSLPAKADVTVEIYNVLGQRVRQLWDAPLSAGDHAVEWNGRDDRGAAVASGVYFYRVVAGDEAISRKMLMVK